jgi:hypothetical protein
MQSNDLISFLPIVLVLLLMIRRTQKPKLVTTQRLLIAPAILTAMVLFYIYVAMQRGPHLGLHDDLIILAGGAIGVVIGVLRAKLMHLHRREDAQIEAKLTMGGLAFIVVWVIGRAVLRKMNLVDTASPFGVFTDATLALAVGAVTARTFVLLRRCRALHDAAQPSRVGPAG